MKIVFRKRTPQEIGELLAKISIIAFFVTSYCIVSTLDFKLLYGGWYA